MMKIRNKKLITIIDLEDEKHYTFYNDKIEYFGARLNVSTKLVEYFIKVYNFDTLIVSKKDFEQLKKYMEEERDVVWVDEDDE